MAAEAARKDLNGQISGGLRSVPEILELPGALNRRGFWQQLKGRFRRDGKADRNGEAPGEVEEEKPGTDEAPKRE